MPFDNLPGQFYLPSRQDLVDRWKRDFSIRFAGAKTSTGTIPDARAQVIADSLLPVYMNAGIIAKGTANIYDMTSAQLLTECDRLGIPGRIGATGANGFVKISASIGGGNIAQGAVLTNPNTKVTYQCAVTGTYTNGAAVPITGITTGPQSNCDADTVLQWVSPPPGIGTNCTVLAQVDGAGLEGGSGEETDAHIVSRIQSARANPPAAGNDAQIREYARATPGVPVEEVFTYPCIMGPGTTAITFTVRPSAPGASRVPNATQRALVLAYVQGQLPGDDGIFMCSIVPTPIDICFQIEWNTSWLDTSPWPLYSSALPVCVNAADVSPTASSVELDISGSTALGAQGLPPIGSTITFYNTATNTFVRKRVLTATAITLSTGAHAGVSLTFDMTNGASDPSYIPSDTELCCPWSDSLADLPGKIVSGDVIESEIFGGFDNLGPGEQKAAFFDAGLRQKRLPTSPGSWPSIITTRVQTPIERLASVQEVSILQPALPYAAPVGTPGVSSGLTTLRGVFAFQR